MSLNVSEQCRADVFAAVVTVWQRVDLIRALLLGVMGSFVSSCRSLAMRCVCSGTGALCAEL